MNASFEPLGGACLCGAIAFAITAPVIAMGHCHCGICRRAHGTAFSTYCQVAADALVVSRGATALADFASSKAAVRQFCQHCGSKLFFRAHALPRFVWVAAGTIHDDPGLRPGYHIFVASKASWYDIQDTLPRYDEFPPDAAH
ncbi:MAG: GFA family protein [Gammaproteobacteria bacterium]